MDPKRTGSVLLAGYLPGREEPVPQLPGALEERPRGGGHLTSAGRTHVEATLQTPRGRGNVPLGADEALRPPQTLQVRHTGLLVGKELAELDEGPRVVAARSGLDWPGFDHDRSL